MDDTDLSFWNFKFGVEVSTLYHDWRRGTLEAAVRFARGATFLGAIFTLLTALNPFDWAPHFVIWSITAWTIAIACINLWELVSHLNETALKHTDLYRRFMSLQEEMARERLSWKELLPEWEAEAVAIRSDEPAVMWAVYAECWNQVMDRYQLEKKGYYRPVQLWQHALRNLFQFSPRNFPASA
jgi:hypothetical protein